MKNKLIAATHVTAPYARPVSIACMLIVVVADLTKK
jgi:hypothetical protein